MELHIFMVAAILLGSLTGLSWSNQLTSLYLCTANRALSVQITEKPGCNHMDCKCTLGLATNLNFRGDYVHTPGIGSHKLHQGATTWNEARKICHEENAHLAIINSKAEETVLLNILNNNSWKIKNTKCKNQAFLGIHDLFHKGEWSTIFGENLYSTGYSEWSTDWFGQQPDNKDFIQHCASLVSKGGMDDVNCKDNLAFFCELPITCTNQ